MFKIGLYPVGISDTQTMYSGGTWQLMRARSHQNQVVVLRELCPGNCPQRLLAQTSVVGCLVWNGYVSELVNWDFGRVSWGMPAAPISSLNLPPSRTVLMKGKHIRCSFLCFDSVPCRPGVQPRESNRKLQLRLYLTGFIVLSGVYKFRDGFELE